MVANLEILASVITFHLNLDIGSLDLRECLALSNGHDNGFDFCINRELGSVGDTNSKDYKRLSARKIKFLVAVGLVMHPRDSSNYNGSNWHPLLEIEVGLITQLVEPSSDDAVVADLHKAPSLPNVDNIPDRQVSLRKCNLGTVFKNLVSLIASGLLVSILLLESNTRSFWSDLFPCILVQNRLSGAQLQLPVLVGVDYSGSKYTLLR